MRWARHFAAICVCGLFAACSDPQADGDDTNGAGVHLETIRPGDFALRGCGGIDDGPPCAIVHAGGKVLVFGAPEGVASALGTVGAPVPDAVFLFSHRGEDIEGLMRLRNRTWHAGRKTPLGLVGPEGTVELARALESVLSRSDAIRWTEAPPAGGFDIAPLLARELPPGRSAKVFDSGDLQVSAASAGASDLSYAIAYGGRTLRLSPCRAGVRAPDGAADRHVGCPEAGGDLSWPLPAAAIVLNRD